MFSDTYPVAPPERHNSDSLIETLDDNFPMPQRPVIRSRIQASASVLVRLSLWKSVSVMSLKPLRIHRPTTGEKHLLKLAKHPHTRIPTRPWLLSASFPGSSSVNARTVHVSKRPRSLDDDVVTPKRARSQMLALPAAAALPQASLIGNFYSVPVLHQKAFCLSFKSSADTVWSWFIGLSIPLGAFLAFSILRW